jgi:hypothetical protein
MRRLLLLTLVAVLVAALAAPVAAKQAERTQLPFKGTFAGYLIGFGDVTEGRCDDSPDGKVAWAVTSFEGWGTATHMGKTYIYAEHCSYSTDGTQMTADGTYGEGQLTMEAANGDILTGTYAGGVSLSPPPLIGFTDDFTFTDGGTGRFTFASGGGVEEGSVDLSDGSFTVQMEGVISYSRR